MDENSIEQQISVKKSITSWLLGLIGIILAIFGGVFFILLMPDNLYYSIPSKSWFDVIFFYYLVILVVVICGLVKGVKELKSVKRKQGIMGVVLSSIGLILVIVVGFLLELYVFVGTT